MRIGRTVEALHHILMGGRWGARWILGQSLYAVHLPRPGYIWQDSARTTPALATNPVGAVDDFYGNGRNLTQATAGLRPVSAVTSGVYSLTLDGADDGLSLSATYGAGGLTFCGVASISSGNNYPMLVAGTAGGAELRCFSNTREIEVNYGSTEATYTTPLTAGTTYVLSGRFGAGGIDVRVNGVSQASAAGVTVADQTVLAVGFRGDGTLPWPGSIFGAVVALGSVTDRQALFLDKWLGKMCGVTI